MPTIRTYHNKENPFVTLNKAPLNDGSLSFRAKGLWAYCLSKPVDWHFSVAQVLGQVKEGRDALYGAFKELIIGGYCVRVQGHIHQRNGKNKLTKVEYIVLEFKASPMEVEEIKEKFKKSLLLTAFQETGFPYAPPSATPIITLKNDNELKNKKGVATPDSLSNNFQKVREKVTITSRQLALLAKELTPDEIEAVFDKLNTYKLETGKIYTSDFGAIKRWVIGAIREDQNMKKLKEQSKETNLEFIKKLITYLERKQMRGDLRISGDEASDQVFNKTCALNNPKLPGVVCGWYGLTKEQIASNSRFKGASSHY